MLPFGRVKLKCWFGREWISLLLNDGPPNIGTTTECTNHMQIPNMICSVVWFTFQLNHDIELTKIRPTMTRIGQTIGEHFWYARVLEQKRNEEVSCETMCRIIDEFLRRSHVNRWTFLFLSIFWCCYGKWFNNTFIVCDMMWFRRLVRASSWYFLNIQMVKRIVAQ